MRNTKQDENLAVLLMMILLIFVVVGMASILTGTAVACNPPSSSVSWVGEILGMSYQDCTDITRPFSVMFLGLFTLSGIHITLCASAFIIINVCKFPWRKKIRRLPAHCMTSERPLGRRGQHGGWGGRS